MKPEEKRQWREADAALDRLLDLAPDARHAALAALDPALQPLVERLLQGLEAGALDKPLEFEVPRSVGRWTLEAEIGRGGMAVVYRAHRVVQGTRQRAAVKIMTVGALAADGRRRFDQEHAVLARLAHPRITPLIDAGVLDDGTPWLAMPLVEGIRIDEWCRSRQLGPAAIVRLYLQVFDGVAHAHRHLVVHRDLKPSNLLVDADGHVHLLDFGIARLLDDADAETTGTRGRALTPQYAAPEQFRGGDSGVGVDVFGLGAVLYLLLTGRPPRLPEDGHDTRITRPSRAAAEGEALPPELRISFSRSLRGDLDLILLKALAHDPDDRYADVAALGDDVRAWLDRRPVKAVRPDTLYRARKFVARHRGGVAASLLIVAAVLAGLIGTVWQAQRAEREAVRARAEADRASAVSGYLESLLMALVPSVPELAAPPKDRVVEEAGLRAERELADQPALLASVQLTLARIDARLGLYARALERTQGAHARLLVAHGPDHLDTARANVLLAELLRATGSSDHAHIMALLTGSLATFESSAGSASDRVEALLGLAALHSELAEPTPALEFLNQALTLRRDEGDRLARAGIDFLRARQLSRIDRRPEALDLYEDALAVHVEHLGEYHADSADVMSEFGGALASADELGRGIELLERALRIQAEVYTRPANTSLHTRLHLANAYARAGRLDDALAMAGDYIEAARNLFGPRSNDVASGLHQRSLFQLRVGAFEQALADAREATSIFSERFGAFHPRTAVSDANIGAILLAMGRLDEAEVALIESRKRYRELFGADSTRYGSAQTQLGNLYLRSDRPDAARDALAEAHAIYHAHYGPTHAWTLSVGVQLAEAQRQSAADEDALGTLDGLAEAIDARFGDRDPTAALAHLVRARVFCGRGEAECREAARQALDSLLAAHGEEHERTHEARSLLEGG